MQPPDDRQRVQDDDVYDHGYTAGMRDGEEMRVALRTENERLSAYLEVVEREVSYAYDAITFGRISKPNTLHGYVEEAVDERIDKLIKEAKEPLDAKIAELRAALEDYAIIENAEGNGQCQICDEVEDHKPDCLLKEADDEWKCPKCGGTQYTSVGRGIMTAPPRYTYGKQCANPKCGWVVEEADDATSV